MAHLYDHDLANPNQLDNNGLTLDDANRDHDYYAYQLYMDAGLPMSTTVYTQYDQSESQPWIYADSNTNQSRPRNGVQSNPFGQTPIWNAMHHPTVEGYNVLEGSHTSIPYTGYDPTQSYLHTPAAVPSVHAHMNLQPYNGGDIQSAGQATSSRYLENQLSEGNCQDTVQCYWRNCGHYLIFPDNKALMYHVEMVHINPRNDGDQENHGGISKWKCSWKDCTSSIGKKSSMVRHVKTLHIEKGAFPCPLCGRLCNRNDNLVDHMKTAHWALTR